IATLRQSAPVQPHCPFASSQSSSRLSIEAFVCFGIPISTGGDICENTKFLLHWAICERGPGAPLASLCYGTQSAGPCPRNGSAPIPRWRTCLLQLHLHHARPNDWNSERHSGNSSSYFFARRGFQLHVGLPS